MTRAPIKVLLVEDNPGDARLIREMLAEAGEGQFVITHVERLGDAFHRLDEEHDDVILLDLSLPDSHGLETFSEIHDRGSGVPVIVLTGLGDESIAVKAMQEGAQDYLVKGEVVGALLARSIRYAIERHKKVSEELQEATKEKTGKVIGFIGAKGGVGTTTVALNVATALVQMERSVVALEFRSSPGTFSLQMNQTPSDGLQNLLQLDSKRIDERELRMRLVKTPFGLDVLFGPQRINEIEELEYDQAEAVINGLTGIADYTVVDFPCHPSRASQAAIKLCNFVGLVVEPEPVCLDLAKGTLELLASWGVGEARMGVVAVNRTPLPEPVSLATIQDRLGLEIFGVVYPAAEAINAAHTQQRGIPLVMSQPQNLASSNLADLARRLDLEKPMPMRF